MWWAIFLILIMFVNFLSFKESVEYLVLGEEGVLLGEYELSTNPGITDNGLIVLTFILPPFGEGRLSVTSQLNDELLRKDRLDQLVHCHRCGW